MINVILDLNFQKKKTLHIIKDLVDMEYISSRDIRKAISKGYIEESDLYVDIYRGNNKGLSNKNFMELRKYQLFRTGTTNSLSMEWPLKLNDNIYNDELLIGYWLAYKCYIDSFIFGTKRWGHKNSGNIHSAVNCHFGNKLIMDSQSSYYEDGTILEIRDELLEKIEKIKNALQKIENDEIDLQKKYINNLSK